MTENFKKFSETSIAKLFPEHSEASAQLKTYRVPHSNAGSLLL